MKMNLVIIGASGLAREVYDLALICYKDNAGFRVKGFLSDFPSNIEKLGYPKVLGKIYEYKIEVDDVGVEHYILALEPNGLHVNYFKF